MGGLVQTQLGRNAHSLLLRLLPEVLEEQITIGPETEAHASALARPTPACFLDASDALARKTTAGNGTSARGQETAVKLKTPAVVLIGLIGLLSACGDGQGDDDGAGGEGNSGASGGTASGGSSGSGGSAGGPGSGGSGALAGRGGAAGNGATGGSGAGKGGSSGSAGSTALPQDFPTGFGAPEVVLGDMTNPARLGFHDGYLYFTEMGTRETTDSRLGRISPSGDVETILTGQDIAGMYLDDDELFVSERGTRRVFRVPYATLTPELFVEAELMVADIERIGERIWLTLFSSESPRTTGVYALDRTTKERTELLPIASADIIFTYLSAAGDNLYLSTSPSNSSSANHGFYKRSGTTAGVTVPGILVNHTSTDANYVYFADETSGMIFRQAHNANNQPEVLATGQVQPYSVQVTADGIYWSNSAHCNGVTPGSVKALPLAGGTPIPVAEDEMCPESIATDANYVYWTRTLAAEGSENDSIMRARKLR
jgi:hypothetical protein